MLAVDKILGDGTVLIEGPGDDAVWDFSSILFSPPFPIPWAAAPYPGSSDAYIAYAAGNIPPAAPGAPLEFSVFQAVSGVTGRYLLLQFSWDELFWGTTENWFVDAGIDYYAVLSVAAPAIPTPVIVSVTRTGNSGVAVIDNVHVGHVVMVFAFGSLLPSPSVSLVGSATGAGGPVTVPLNFAGFSFTWEGMNIPLPEAVFAQTRSGLFAYSRVSATARAGLFDGDWGASISAVSRSVDRLSAVVTLAGVPAGGVAIIGWNKLDGSAGLAQFSGPGDHVVTGLEYEATFSPTLIGVSPTTARVAELCGYCERATLPALPAGVTDLIAELAGWLSLELGYPLGAKCFYHQQPDDDTLTPPAVLVRHSGGASQIDHDAWRDLQAQVLVTGAAGGLAAAQTLALQVDALLHATSNWLLPHWRVDYVLKVQEPFFLGLDERKRPQFAQNFMLEATRR